MEEKHHNGLESFLKRYIEKTDARMARNEESFNTYLKHNEREKDRIWKTLSEHRRIFTHLERRIDRSLDEIKRMRLEFQRWVREQ